jgi:hypothetical protein
LFHVNKQELTLTDGQITSLLAFRTGNIISTGSFSFLYQLANFHSDKMGSKFHVSHVELPANGSCALRPQCSYQHTRVLYIAVLQCEAKTLLFITVRLWSYSESHNERLWAGFKLLCCKHQKT